MEKKKETSREKTSVLRLVAEESRVEHNVDVGSAGAGEVQTHHHSAEEEGREERKADDLEVKKTMQKREKEILVWEEEPDSSMGIITMPVTCWGGTHTLAITHLPFNFLICQINIKTSFLYFIKFSNV